MKLYLRVMLNERTLLTAGECVGRKMKRFSNDMYMYQVFEDQWTRSPVTSRLTRVGKGSTSYLPHNIYLTINGRQNHDQLDSIFR